MGKGVAMVKDKVPTPAQIADKMEKVYNKVFEESEKTKPKSYFFMRNLSHEAGVEKQLATKNGKVDHSKPWMTYTMPHSIGRSVKQTYDNIRLLDPKNPEHAQVLKKLDKSLDKVPQTIKNRKMFSLNLSTSLHKDSAEKVHFLVPHEFSRLSEFVRRQFSRWKTEGKSPEGRILFVPDFGKKKGEGLDSKNIEKNKNIFFDPKKRITFILGSNYAGEGKKSMMRVAQFIHTHVKKKGLGIHAGGFEAEFEDGKRVGNLVFGLSGTGKSTTSMMNFDAFKNRFKQDDMFLLNWNGSAHGMERGMYVKTDWSTNNPEEDKIQGSVIKAAKKHTAMIENVHLKDGEPDFVGSKKEFPNGRALVSRSDFELADEDPNMEKVHNIFFNVRGPFPVLQKLKNPEQAATFFALGETIKRAGTVVEKKSKDKIALEKKEKKLQKILKKKKIPKAGFINMLNALYTVKPEMRESFPHFEKVKKVLKETGMDFDKVMEHKPWQEVPTHEMGFDPFTPEGFKEERIDAIKKFLEKNPHVNVYLMNTGSVGAKDIGISDTRKVMEAVIAKKKIDWEENKETGTLVAKGIEGMDNFDKDFNPENQFGKEVYNSVLHNLKKDRKEYLKQFSSLDYLTLDGKNKLFEKKEFKNQREKRLHETHKALRKR